MTVNLKGIVTGKHIELERETGLPPGSEVKVSLSIEKPELSLDEKRALLEKLFGSWANDPSIPGIFERIAGERKKDLPREIDLDAAP
jgi:hypothetical protein